MEICYDYGIQVIDIYTLAQFNEQTIDIYTTDGLHPNVIGNALIGNIVSNAFLNRNNTPIFRNAVLSNPYKEITGFVPVLNIGKVTQANYDAGTPVTGTLYLIP